MQLTSALRQRVRTWYMTKTVYDYDRFVDLIKRYSCKGNNVLILGTADSYELHGAIPLNCCTGTFEATFKESDRRVVLHERYKDESGIHRLDDDMGNEQRRIIALSEVYQEVLFLRRSLPLAEVKFWNSKENREFTQQEIDAVNTRAEKLGALLWHL